MEINFVNQASIKRKQETSLRKNQKIIYEKNKYLITLKKYSCETIPNKIQNTQSQFTTTSKL